MQLTDKVQGLIDSDISAYRINQITHVPQSTVTDLRNSKRTVDSMSLENAEKLGKYYDAAMMDIAVNGDNNEYLANFKPALNSLFQDLIDSQMDLANSDEAVPDDRAMAEVLVELFNDTMQDNIEIGRLISEYRKSMRHNED